MKNIYFILYFGLAFLVPQFRRLYPLFVFASFHVFLVFILYPWPCLLVSAKLNLYLFFRMCHKCNRTLSHRTFSSPDKKDAYDILYVFHVILLFQITETYAFLPREAVTRFLLGCTECQKHPRSPSPSPSPASVLPTPSPSPTLPTIQHQAATGVSTALPSAVSLSTPMTTTGNLTPQTQQQMVLQNDNSGAATGNYYGLKNGGK